MMRRCAPGVTAVSLLLVAGLGTVWCAATRGETADKLSASVALAAAIDRLVAEAGVGPSAGLCSDADFVRRVHLDLVGVIPTPERVRAFLADPAPDRRSRLIDELMASRGFVRQMGLVFDAMLLERDRPPGGLAEPWQAWLRDAVAVERPLDELLGEVVAAEGGDPEATPAAAFLLAREAEPVKMTRAVGRILFGRDLQCAQCHDHPLDDDLRQAEFHGLHAFVKRTSLFTSGKAQQLSEAAVGEVDFTSVFTEESVKAAWPQLPDGPPLIEEPIVEPGDGYVIAPLKSSRGVAEFSRRGALDERLAESDTFRRNLANRLWAVFFGQGMVHPLDGLGPENPASHPLLLDCLVEALVADDYQLRPIVRGIVLSSTYQRSVETPSWASVDAAALQAQLSSIEAKQAMLTQEREPLERAAEAAEARRQAAYDAERAIHVELQPTVAERTETRKGFNEALKAAAAAEASRTTAATVADAVEAALAEVRRASELLAGDAAVTGVLATLEAEQETRAAAVEVAAAAASEKTAAKRAAEEKLTTARAAFAEVAARRSPATLVDLTREADDARRQLVLCQQQLDRLAWRHKLAADMLRVPSLAEADPPAAATIWASVVERMTENLQVGRLRPLSPNQFAFSLLQATGGLARLEAAAIATIDKEPPTAVTEAADGEKAAAREKAIEQAFLKQAGSVLGSFHALYAYPLVEGFQATLNQALYLGNAPQVSGELSPSGENLAARLLAVESPAAADEVCLAVFSRPASDDEKADIAGFLEVPAEQRPQAVAELIWALLSSSEFRFNH